MTLRLTQRPDHVTHIGEIVLIDGDPWTVEEITPRQDLGVFLDWNQRVEFNVVDVTVKRVEKA